MGETVEVLLNRALDSVTVINDINTNGLSSSHAMETQEETNAVVNRNVKHIELILAFDGSDGVNPDVVNDDSDKSVHTNAITTGKAYIEENS